MLSLSLQTTALAAWLFLALADNDNATVRDQSRRLDKNGCTYLPWKKETECTGPRVDAKLKRKENLADEKDARLKAEAAQRNYELSIKASPAMVGLARLHTHIHACFPLLYSHPMHCFVDLGMERWRAVNKETRTRH